MSGEFQPQMYQPLQMFTHLSPTPFVGEQNPWKDAKIKVACHSRSLAHP